MSPIPASLALSIEAETRAPGVSTNLRSWVISLYFMPPSAVTSGNSTSACMFMLGTFIFPPIAPMSMPISTLISNACLVPFGILYVSLTRGSLPGSSTLTPGCVGRRGRGDRARRAGEQPAALPEPALALPEPAALPSEPVVAAPEPVAPPWSFLQPTIAATHTSDTKYFRIARDYTDSGGPVGRNSPDSGVASEARSTPEDPD